MHATALIRIRPSACHLHSLLQLIHRHKPNISHLRVFGCAIYVPIAPPQSEKMNLQRILGIYVSYESPTILKYLEPLTDDLFTAHFAYCQFKETHFPILRGGKTFFSTKECQEIS